MSSSENITSSSSQFSIDSITSSSNQEENKDVLQQLIDEHFNNTILEIKGRHDPCIVRRARVVIDSLVALCLLDLISINEGKKWMC